MSLVESPRPIQLVAILFAIMLGLCLIAVSQTPASLHPLTGTWKLNLARSSYEAGPPPYKRSICKITALADGLKVTYDMVGIRGGVTHIEWIGKLDGKDYPIEGVDEVLTNAYTRIDDRTYDVVVKVDGAKAATARIVIAADGKTLISTTSTRNSQGHTLRNITVYEKQ